MLRFHSFSFQGRGPDADEHRRTSAHIICYFFQLAVLRPHHHNSCVQRRDNKKTNVVPGRPIRQLVNRQSPLSPTFPTNLLRIMPLIHTSTMKLLAIVLTLSSAAQGYTRSTTTNRTFVRRIEIEKIHTLERVTPPAIQKVVVPSPSNENTKAKETSATEAPTRATYDFGIGKNKPVYGKASHSSSLTTNTIEEAAKYWVEHEAIQEFPSPISAAPQEESFTKPTTASKQRPAVPKVQPKRRTKDALHIEHPPLNDETRSQAAPAAVPSMRRTSSVQLDVNTAWVEMMLHSEQMKTLAAAAAAASH
jgi:hypothetical protein